MNIADPNQVNHKVGISLKNARIGCGLSVEHVSNVTNISESTLYMYEKDPEQMDLKTAVALAYCYGVEVDDICFVSGE
jgi:DNA-binding XRE family transcriptional regulator